MSSPTVKELYKKKFELFPCSMKTRENHDHFYKYAIEQYANVQIDRITPADVQKSVNEYGAEHSINLTSHLLSIWRQIFRTARMLEIPVTDKTMMVMIPKPKTIERHRSVDISDKDFNIFMDALLN